VTRPVKLIGIGAVVLVVLFIGWVAVHWIRGSLPDEIWIKVPDEKAAVATDIRYEPGGEPVLKYVFSAELDTDDRVMPEPAKIRLVAGRGPLSEWIEPAWPATEAEYRNATPHVSIRTPHGVYWRYVRQR